MRGCEIINIQTVKTRIRAGWSPKHPLHRLSPGRTVSQLASTPRLLAGSPLPIDDQANAMALCLRKLSVCIRLCANTNHNSTARARFTPLTTN
jgi:hypothetical protein